jgi:uncharacterized protein YbjT (DUF2867 family)
MSKSRVFVIGASGNVGKATINALARNYGEKLDIRAGVRNPEKVAEFTSLQGVTVVRAEMGKRDELIEIFKDVDVLFIVVPGAGDRVELTRVTAEAAREAGVKHILCLGSPTPNISIGKQMYDIEEIITNLGLNYTILRLPWFMDNYFAFKETIQKLSVVYDSVDPTKRFGAICMDDLGLAAAVVLSSPEKHAGKKYLLVSDRHSFKDLVKAFSEALGKDVKYIQQSYEEAKVVWLQKGVPEQNVDGLIEYWKEANAGKYEEGNDNDFAAITEKQPTSVAAWVQRYASVFK